MLNSQVECSCDLQGTNGGFCDRGGLVYGGNIYGRDSAHQDSERGTFLGGFGRMLLRENFMRLKFSEMQSSALWTLRFSKCLDSIINHRCGCGQRSTVLKHFMMLAGPKRLQLQHNLPAKPTYKTFKFNH